MSTFGKVLVVLNVLAAGAFVFLAAQSRGTRHAWNYTAERHELALTGLPLNNEEKDADGEPLARKHTENTLRNILPDGAVRTQEEEVNRRKQQLKDEIDQEQGEAAKRKKLEEILLLTKRTGGEREELREKIRTGKMEELLGSEGPFEKTFADALSPTNAEGRRSSIAYLLIALAKVPDDLQKTGQNLQRVYNVVGVRHYTRAMEEHALNTRDMGNRVRGAIAQEQGRFILQHDDIVQHILAMADHIEDLKRHRQQLQEQRDENYQALVAARTNDLKNLTAELTAVRKALAGEMARQAGLEKTLFAIQRKLGEASEKNLQLERDIRKLEVNSERKR